MERGARDVVVTPFGHQNVVASLLQHVGHIVLQVAQVFDLQLLTGNLRAADTHQEHVLTWEEEDKEAEEEEHKALSGQAWLPYVMFIFFPTVLSIEKHQIKKTEIDHILNPFPIL